VRSPLDLNACVTECLALFRPEFERRKIALVTEWSQQVEKVEPMSSNSRKCLTI